MAKKSKDEQKELFREKQKETADMFAALDKLKAEANSTGSQGAKNAAKGAKAKKGDKKAAKPKKGDAVADVADDAVVSSEEVSTEAVEEQTEKVKKGKVRSKKYAEKRSLVDKTKAYSVAEAVALVKSMSYSKFDGSVEAHLQLREAGVSATITYPNSTGKSVKAAIVSEEILDEISKGILNFDILIARPEDMKNLAKFARVLGPKGLMPNPKNGTVTPKPELKKKELEAGAVTLKTEKKAPLVHTIVGKVSMDDKALTENIETLLKGFVNKSVRLYITASMSPSVRVQV